MGMYSILTRAMLLFSYHFCILDYVIWVGNSIANATVGTMHVFGLK